MALGHQACRCLGKSLRQGTGENRGPEGGPGLQAATRRQLWLEHRKGDRQGQHGSPLGLFILTVTETTGGLRIREQHKLKPPWLPDMGPVAFLPAHRAPCFPSPISRLRTVFLCVPHLYISKSKGCDSFTVRPPGPCTQSPCMQ